MYSRTASSIFRRTATAASWMNILKSSTMIFGMPWTSAVIVVNPMFPSSSSFPKLMVTTVKAKVTTLVARVARR